MSKKISKEERDQEVARTWDSYRKLGKAKYVFRYGIISWGLVTWLIYYVINILVGFIDPSWALPMNNTITLISSLVFFSLGGLAFGMILWARNEKVYKKKYPYKK